MENLYNIAKDLITWYQKNARILPWRENISPYGVWISEIMLQQTRVEAVKKYYIRFMEELPTIKELSEVSDEKLLKLWQGLGYYNRAKNLKKTAIEVMEQYQGVIPNSYEKLLQLKGIGEYTAGAICSIAFGLPESAVDGNVLRVMTRLYAYEKDIMDKQVKKEFSIAIKEVLKHTNPSLFNQSIMELGAMVCLPNGTPKCNECPLQKYCKAYHQNRVMEFPHKSPKKQRRIEYRTMFFIICQNKLALHKRPETGLLSNLWELPNGLKEISLFEQLLQWGVRYATIDEMGKTKHIFTHIQWNMEGYYIQTDSFENCADFVWVTQCELQQKYALPSAFSVYVKKGFEMFNK